MDLYSNGDKMNANELTALISECLRETDDHEFFLKLESVLRQQQAEIDALQKLVQLQYEDAIVQGHEIDALREEREGLCVFCENRALSKKAEKK
jgi:hypothetical protein